LKPVFFFNWPFIAGLLCLKIHDPQQRHAEVHRKGIQGLVAGS